MRTLTIGSIFAGIGGFELGFGLEGFKCLWSIEIEKPCQQVIIRSFPGSKVFGDVRDVDPDQLECPDILTFGFPCTDTSVAGKGEGINSGTRSGLFYESTRIAKGLIPRGLQLALAENVPGLITSSSGGDLAKVIGELGKLGALDVGWATLDAQWRGLAQRRKRVFIVSDFRGQRAEEILSLSEGLRWDNPPSRKAGQEVAGTLGSSPKGSGPRTDTERTTFIPEVAKCLNAGRDGYNDGSDQTYIPEVAYALAAAEGGRFGSGRDAQDTFIAKRIQAYNLHSANSCAMQGDGDSEAAIQTDVARTIDSAGPTHSQGGTVIAFTSVDSGSDASNNVSPPVRSGNHKDSHANGGAPPAIAFQPRYYTRDNKTGGAPGEVSPPLTAAESRSRGGAITAVAGGEWGVRRLTPTECEVLQGFPIGWTAGFSDSMRYRMLGNSVAIPVVRYIAQRMRKALVDKQPDAS